MEENWVISNLNNVLSIWNRRLKEIYTLLSMSPKEFKGGGIWKVMVNINGSLKAVGLALVVLFFLMGAVRTTSSMDQIKKPEHVVRLLIRFVLARSAVVYGLDLMLSVYEIVQGIIYQVLKGSGITDLRQMTLPGSIVKAVNEASFLESIPLWAITLLASVAILIISMVLILSVYGRFFKIYMYTALSPIPLSTCAASITQQTGISFVKSYIGVLMEGAVIIISCIIYSAFISSAPVVNPAGSPVTVLFTYTGEIIFNMLVLVGTVKLSDRITKEMMGL